MPKQASQAKISKPTKQSKFGAQTFGVSRLTVQKKAKMQS
jgi:hypothetical protein